ncbi:putative ribonuclease H-like domain-containing protein [Tanacetum coccineum]
MFLNTTGNPQLELQEKGVIDSGCSRHMTGNKSYLTDYEEINGGFVAFGCSTKRGKITRKGKIRTSKLDFEDVYFVKELKFNLFSVSQMCDKKNGVLFTDTECVVLSPDFKLLDESQVLLRVPRKNNMYSVDLKNVVPSGGLTCLFAKATLNESNLWHRRLGHINFKTMNKLDETSGILKAFITGIENQINHRVKIIRCDNGIEFKNKEMNQFCEMKGIKREFSVARTPQQNRVAKKKNRTLIEAARTMLADLIPFGYLVTILNTLDHLSKFDGKADKEFFVRFSINSKAFRVFNSRTRIVEETLHITFLENKPNVAGSGLEWLFDIDTLTKSMNYKPVVAGNQSNSSVGTKFVDPLFSQSSKDSPDVGFKPSGEEQEKDANDHEKDSNANSTNNINTVSSHINAASIEDNVANENIVYGCVDDPNIPDLEEIGRFSNAENNNSRADMNNLDTYFQVIPVPTTRIHRDHPLNQTLVDLPYGKRAIGTKWVYGNKKDERGIVVRNKARLVAQGYTQEEGIDYDEVFAPVTRIEAIMLFLAYASFKDFVVYQMDVKSAFFYGKIEEEVYICQPPGFEDPEFPDKVYKLTLFLGLQVTQKNDGIFISQDKHMEEILKKFGFLTVKTTSTPMKTSKPLLKDAEAEDVDVHLYRSIILSLMYLTAFRPDIKFDDLPFDLKAYTNSDYAGASLDMKSIIGGCQFLGRRLISWQYKKQTIVANSTTKAEYVAATIKNPVFHSKTKHIEIRHHFIRDSNEKKLIQMIKIHTNQNVADLLIKAFDVGRFQYLIASIGCKYWNA